MTTELALSIAPWDYNLPLDPADQVNAANLKTLSPQVRRARFIHALHNGHTVRWACAYAGMDYADTYRLKKSCPEFGEAWDAAQLGPGGDVWEDLLLSKAESNNPASVTAVVVGLKMRKRFVENAPSGDRPVQVRIINVVRGDSASETMRIDNVPVRDNVRELPSGQQPDTDTPD